LKAKSLAGEAQTKPHPPGARRWH